MPTITVFPDVVRAYNRVEINWADQPSVDYARVLRVDLTTGQCTPLRPYICFDGDYINVSCDGHGIFWDTEVPLDRSVYYITEALSGAHCTPSEVVASDAFTRTVGLGSWGNANVGGAWTVSGGTVGTDYAVNGSRGVVNLTSVNVARQTTLGVSMRDGIVATTVTVPTTAVVTSTLAGVIGRFMGAGNFYLGEVQFTPAGTVSVQLSVSVAGVVTTLSTAATGFAYAPGDQFRIKMQMEGPNLSLKAWPYNVQPEPDNYQVTAINAAFPAAGGVGTRSILASGNGNALPYTFLFDDFVAYEKCIPCIPNTAQSGQTTMPSNGAFRLKDPVRPCNDLYVPLCFDPADPNCAPGSGVFFASMDTENYESNTLLLGPTNASAPLAMNRARRTKASVLQLVTRTFADRDDLLKINQAGSPLLFQGPPEYGIPDSYLSIGGISVARGVTDHRYPVRTNTLPFNTVNRPSGPTQGVCGSRVADLCDFTFAELAAEGNTWEDLVRGRPTGMEGGA